MGDVEHQAQLRRARLVWQQRHVVHAVVGAGVLQAVQAWRCGQCDARCAVIPALAGGRNAQRQVGLPVEFSAQLRFALGEQLWRIHTLQRAAQRHQFAVEQLLVEFDKVRLTGLVEEHAGDQRDHRRARRKQQRQAAGQGQALDQLHRSSNT